MSQLLDSNVTDLILRAQMYRDILKATVTGETELTQHEINGDEQYRSDLISFRVYGRSDLAWLVDLIASREDIAFPHDVGTTLQLPDTVFIRNKIKYYSVLEGRLNNA